MSSRFSASSSSITSSNPYAYYYSNLSSSSLPYSSFSPCTSSPSSPLVNSSTISPSNSISSASSSFYYQQYAQTNNSVGKNTYSSFYSSCPSSSSTFSAVQTYLPSVSSTPSGCYSGLYTATSLKNDIFPTSMATSSPFPSSSSSSFSSKISSHIPPPPPGPPPPFIQSKVGTLRNRGGGGRNDRGRKRGGKIQNTPNINDSRNRSRSNSRRMNRSSPRYSSSSPSRSSSPRNNRRRSRSGSRGRRKTRRSSSYGNRGGTEGKRISSHDSNEGGVTRKEGKKKKSESKHKKKDHHKRHHGSRDDKAKKKKKNRYSSSRSRSRSKGKTSVSVSRSSCSSSSDSEIDCVGEEVGEGKTMHLGAHFDALETQNVDVFYVPHNGEREGEEKKIDFNDKFFEKLNLKIFKPVDSFQNARNYIHEDVCAALKKNGVERLTPIQRYSFAAVSSEYNVIASAQTGCGKTLAFLCPIISNILKQGNTFRPYFPGKNAVSSPVALILCPTRELALQIDEQVGMLCADLSLHNMVVYGGETAAEQINDLSIRQCDVMTATPGRLLDLVDLCKVSLTFIKFLTLDEADVMLNMGFHKQIESLVLCRDMADSDCRQTLLFSATFCDSIKSMQNSILKNPYIRISVTSSGKAAAVIKQNVKYVDNRNKIRELLSDLRTTRGKVIVFVAKRNVVYSILSAVKREGHLAEPLHGKMDQASRQDVYSCFKENKFRILVATSIVARGLDFPDVTTVINYDMPSSFDQYAHRIGRTGRIGNEGYAITYFNNGDRSMANQLVGHMQKTYQQVPDWLLNIAQSYTTYPKKNKYTHSHA